MERTYAVAKKSQVDQAISSISCTTFCDQARNGASVYRNLEIKEDNLQVYLYIEKLSMVFRFKDLRGKHRAQITLLYEEEMRFHGELYSECHRFTVIVL